MKHKSKWTLAARKRLSTALKRSWELRKKVTEGIVHTPTTVPTPRKVVTIPQGVRDMDSIVQRFDRMNDRAGEQFLINQLTRMWIKKYGETI